MATIASPIMQDVDAHLDSSMRSRFSPRTGVSLKSYSIVDILLRSKRFLQMMTSAMVWSTQRLVLVEHGIFKI